MDGTKLTSSPRCIPDMVTEILCMGRTTVSTGLPTGLGVSCRYSPPYLCLGCGAFATSAASPILTPPATPFPLTTSEKISQTTDVRRVEIE